MGDIDEVKKSPSALESGEQSSKEADTTKNKKEYKPSNSKFKIQSPRLSPRELLFITWSLFPAPAAVLLIVMSTEEKLDSAKYLFPIVLGITTVFLVVYLAHGVIMRMPYSLVLHCVCIVVVASFYIVYYTLPEDKEPRPNIEQIKIIILAVGETACAVGVVLFPYMFKKYWQAREITFPFGADGDFQDEIVKHLVAMCLLLLNLHLELTFVALILKIEMKGGEIIDVVAGVLVSVSMCVCGFFVLYKKTKRLVICNAVFSVVEVLYIVGNSVNTFLNPKDLSGVILAFIIFLTVASVAVLIFMFAFLFYISKRSWTRNDGEKTKLLQTKSER